MPYEIANISGKVMFSGRLVKGSVTVDVSGLPVGVYILDRYDKDNRRSTQQFVKQ